MLFNTTGGASSGLNFKIVGGTTEPSSPSENTIWVNTDTEITGWEFGFVNSETLGAGGIWIQTATVANISFNALKKNTLMVYPQKIKQLIPNTLTEGAFVECTWTDVSFKIYQNGAWIEPYMYLFAAGNQYADITGGWSGTSFSVNAESCLQAYNADNSGTAQGYISCQLTTINMIDLSSFTKLVVNAVTVKSSGTLCVENSSGTILATINIGEISGTETEIVLDISSVTEKCYIRINGSDYASGNVGADTSFSSTTLVIKEVKLM